MYTAFDFSCLTFTFAMTVALELSVWIGVAGCGWPILVSVILSVTPSFALWKSHPDSASVVDDITLRMILLTVCIAPLGVGVAMGGLVGSAAQEVIVKRPPTLLRDLGSDP